MRTLGAIGLVFVTVACDAPSPLAPEAALVREEATVAVASAPAPTVVICRRHPPVPRRLFILDGRIVDDTTATLAMKEPGVHIEVVAGETAAALYGSRAGAGVTIISARPASGTARQ